MKNTFCEKLMWIAMQGTICKFLSAEFSKSEVQRIKVRFKNNYKQIRDEVDDIGHVMKNPLRICLTGGVV